MQSQHKAHGAHASHERQTQSPGNPFKTPQSQARPDHEILDEIHLRLRDDPLLDASGIFVAVSRGRVLIAGSVENDEAKRRAETHSRQVSGISGHDSNLCIRRSR